MIEAIEIKNVFEKLYPAIVPSPKESECTSLFAEMRCFCISSTIFTEQ
jgi:hypothetical protein